MKTFHTVNWINCRNVYTYTDFLNLVPARFKDLVWCIFSIMALVWICCKDVPSKSTWSYYLEMKKLGWTLDHKFHMTCLWRRAACKIFLKALDISSHTVWVTIDMFKAIVNLSLATVKMWFKRETVATVKC